MAISSTWLCVHNRKRKGISLQYSQVGNKSFAIMIYIKSMRTNALHTMFVISALVTRFENTDLRKTLPTLFLSYL